MKIDIYSHIVPKKYGDALRKREKTGTLLTHLPDYWENETLNNIDIRLRLLERYPDLLQVLTLAVSPLETLVTPSDAIELARMANDEMAELVLKYPNKFITAVACLPLNDIDAAVKEADRAINQLNLGGVQIFTNINEKPLDAPEFKPLYDLMASLDLPMWIHPWGNAMPSHHVKSSYNWPYETASAMERLAVSWVFETYPNIKFITHHCGGGLVPFFGQRVRIPNLRKFYNDTALYGSTPALMCGYDFFGADHILFGTDMPLSSAQRRGSIGAMKYTYGYTLETIESIERMEIPAIDKDKIFAGNARRLLNLPM
jgi:aminocarboxymuconate-semialdehyde decarboxylase